MSELRLREAARAIVLDPDDRILLVEFALPEVVVWATPGGGLSEGETDLDALRRELVEEAGLDVVELGPARLDAHPRQPFGEGRWDGQTERFYLVRTPAFEPAPRLSWDELRAEGMTAIRWWSSTSWRRRRRSVRPARLPALVRELLLHGPPAEPLDVGV